MRGVPVLRVSQGEGQGFRHPEWARLRRAGGAISPDTARLRILGMQRPHTHIKPWVTREEQIERVMNVAVGMYTGLHGIPGNTLHEINERELTAFDVAAREMGHTT